MSRVANWVGQSTSTIGTGNIILDGVIDGFVAFATMGDGAVYYTIADGNNRETGIGILSGNTLQRTSIRETLVDGVLVQTSPAAISLSGGALVFCTFNKDAFELLYQQSLATLAFTQQSIATVNTLNVVIPQYSIKHTARITALASAVAVSAPTGFPSSLSELVLRIKDDGTARAISFNPIFRAFGTGLPTTTIDGKTMYFHFVYNETDVKWDCIDTKVQV